MPLAEAHACALEARLADVLAGVQALVAAGARDEDLSASIEALAIALPGPHDDIVIAAAWLLRIPAADLAAFLRSRWGPDDPAQVRSRFAILRDGHARRAAAARRARAPATQPDALRRRVADLLASGRAKSRAQAFGILGRELGKAPAYLQKRARLDITR
ncbi:MAG: hypothetical protein ACOZDY_08880 [Pseudomonadota bacterium]